MSSLELHVLKMAKDQDVEDPLECKISESGLNLSVGQRQLVCLARVLLKAQKPEHANATTTTQKAAAKILILDEATSSVDAQTDKIIQETIRSELSGLTILTIAHRLDTILDNDRILVLDSGVVAEFDKPQVLLKNKEG
ncbi:unnamed protein product [Ambrosiozyma monospora]|uniref:Unnamed protein product n=1 Tax=Ambrosiozyma monospora TaxID=43982 RepID=A0ACB5UDM1_AMBMO|nr:unnamed protein product [Ambrosiozyma monospora]